jgi:hypothetical protein
VPDGAKGTNIGRLRPGPGETKEIARCLFLAFTAARN